MKKNKDYCPEFAGTVKRRNMIVLCKLETCLAHIIICALRFASLPMIEHSIRSYLEILIFNAWVGQPFAPLTVAMSSCSGVHELAYDKLGL